jgi:3-methyladenine DNA glycosylase/8-oxoguanine DNA glycosylase
MMLTVYVHSADYQPSSTSWQTAATDRSTSFLQSWQAVVGSTPAQDGLPDATASEPFQRAAEIVAAAATEAAAAAASVVVSAASKKIKEQLESLYSSQTIAAGSHGNLSVLPRMVRSL